MLLTNVLKEPLGCLLNEIQHVLEALRPAIEGVGDLGFRTARGVVEEGPDHGGALPAEGSDRSVVLLVHRKNVIEAPAIVERDPSRPLCAEIHTTQARAPLRSLIGWMPNVPRPSSSGVHEDLVLQPLSP